MEQRLKASNTKIRLSKAIQAAGIASRRAAEALIQEGKVVVNGKKIIVPQTLVDLEKDSIVVSGKKIKRPEKKVYFLLNKPKGYICTAAEDKHTRVIDLFDPSLGRLFTVGRLDKDTTGLIIVTNDGHFAQKLIHPSSNVEKEYVAKVDREILHEDLVRLSKGAYVENCFVKPKKVTKVRRGTVKIVVGEGRKREIRKLLEKADFEVSALSRVRVGNLFLGDIPEGHFRPLTEREKELLLQSHEPKSKAKAKAKPKTQSDA